LQHIRLVRLQAKTLKSVAVSQRIDWIESRSEHRDALDQRLVDLLLRADFLPYPVPNASQFSKTGQIKEWLVNLSPDAIVLSGGNNIKEFETRDEVETTLIDYASENSIPLLGICRGMQMLATFFGGSLAKIIGHAGTRHELLPCGEFENRFPETVNSYHDFSVSYLSGELETIATDSKNSCEAIRHTILPMEAWMWHPEREDPFNPKDLLNLRRVLRNEQNPS
jgi:N5-(cytidine 5'-diphosphoramidyl)-L-glutamine hydrolase